MTEPSQTDATPAGTESPAGDAPKPIERVLLTGATGFVGRNVLRELARRGYIVVCLVRSKAKLAAVVRDLDRSRITSVTGSIFDKASLREAVGQSHAVVHLVGIILERRAAGQTFDRVHRQGTINVVDAAVAAGVRRLVHMSALGSRREAVADYHRTKFAAEEYLRHSGLDWTIFQPSVVHGPDGEFMELMRTFVCSLVPPVIPYFGSGENRLQPVSVKDVAYCFAEALTRTDTIGKTFPMGGPRSYSWKELYAACRRHIPRAKRWKPMVGQPVPIAKLLAQTIMRTPLVPSKLKFNVDQVIMSQEDSTCDTEPVETAFGIRLRDFEDELSRYGELIGTAT